MKWCISLLRDYGPLDQSRSNSNELFRFRASIDVDAKSIGPPSTKQSALNPHASLAITIFDIQSRSLGNQRPHPISPLHIGSSIAYKTFSYAHRKELKKRDPALSHWDTTRSPTHLVRYLSHFTAIFSLSRSHIVRQTFTPHPSQQPIFSLISSRHDHLAHPLSHTAPWIQVTQIEQHSACTHSHTHILHHFFLSVLSLSLHTPF